MKAIVQTVKARGERAIVKLTVTHVPDIEDPGDVIKVSNLMMNIESGKNVSVSAEYHGERTIKCLNPMLY